jgi:hypothetical protein
MTPERVLGGLYPEVVAVEQVRVAS